MTNKTRMLKLEWEQLFRLGHNDKSQQRMIQGRERALKDIIGSKFSANDQYTALFALQTTYAIIIKLIAYRTLSEIRFKKPLKNYYEWLNADGAKLRILCEDVENGDVFHSLGISNLLEGDFFSWYSDYKQWSSGIAGHIRKILEILARYENTSGILHSILASRTSFPECRAQKILAGVRSLCRIRNFRFSNDKRNFK